MVKCLLKGFLLTVLHRSKGVGGVSLLLTESAYCIWYKFSGGCLLSDLSWPQLTGGFCVDTCGLLVVRVYWRAF